MAPFWWVTRLPFRRRGEEERTQLPVQLVDHGGHPHLRSRQAADPLRSDPHKLSPPETLRGN